jgi:hypothetical protein
MLLLIASIFFVVSTNHLSFGAGCDPSKFSYNPGPNYELVWKEDFENVGPVKAIINGSPAYAPDPKNWILKTGVSNGGLQNYTDSIQNAYSLVVSWKCLGPIQTILPNIR